jgi:hypothetical protein
MDINYFLLMRGKYNSILDHLDSIIDAFDETREFNSEYVTNEDIAFNIIFSPEANKSFFLERKKHILYLKNLCNEYIKNICNHEFIQDLIDINPDESKSISYCKFCEMNSPSLSSFENRYIERT